MEHEEAPGVASLKEGQALFPLGLALGVTVGAALRGRPWFEHQCSITAPIAILKSVRVRLFDHTLAQFGYLRIRILLDLDRRRSDFRT